MEEKDVKKMWDIDTKIIMGEDITDEEHKFYNQNRKLMISHLKEEYEHWKYHTNDY